MNSSLSYDELKNRKNAQDQSQPKPLVFIGIFPGSCIEWDQGKPIVSDANEQLRGQYAPPTPDPNLVHVNRMGRTCNANVCEVLRVAIREWAQRLPSYLTSNQYEVFQQIQSELGALGPLLRKIASPTFTTEQKAQFKASALTRLNRGLKLQGLDVMIRHPESWEIPTVGSGNAESWEVTPLRLYLMQVASCHADEIDSESQQRHLSDLQLTDTSRGIPAVENIRSVVRREAPIADLRRLWVEVKALIINVEPDTTLQLSLSLYDNSPLKKTFITEEFVIQTVNRGQLAERLASVFDINWDPLNLFLVVKVVRVVPRGSESNCGKYPFGVAVAPLTSLLSPVTTEKVLQVMPFRKTDSFAVMHESIVEAYNPLDRTL